MLMLRLAGVSLVLLSLFHLVLARTFRWRAEVPRLSPINARVFWVHAFFVAFVLMALGLLSASRPDLLLVPSELARDLLGAITLFWICRFVAQPVFFDPVLVEGWSATPLVRRLASALWATYVLVYGNAFAHQVTPGGLGEWIAPFDLGLRSTWLRIFVASIWLVFGLLFKALDTLPRHRQIVARVVGQGWAREITMLVALGETGLGLWMLTGRYLPICAAVQTMAIVSMNTLELKFARDLLLSAKLMIAANAVFLSLGWYVALTS